MQTTGKPTSRPYCPMMMAVVVAAAIFCSGIDVVNGQVKMPPGTKLLNSKDAVQYKDCDHLHKAGYNISGVHRLHMNHTTSFLIWCEFTKDNAYTVIQQRTDGNVNFIQEMSAYVAGFGVVSASYWAGLNPINYLTEIQGNRVLTVTLHDWAGNVKQGQYRTFLVQSNAFNYRMIAGSYNTRTGLIDDLSFNSGQPFSTYDRPDSRNCALQAKAGWWYNYCTYTLLNGYYYISGHYTPAAKFYDGIFWKDWGDYGYSFRFVQMSVSKV